MYNQITIPEMEQDIDSVSDILSVTPHYSYENEFFASSYGGGLLHFQDGQLIERYSYYNSTLQPRIGQNSNVLVSSSLLIPKEIYGFLTLTRIHHFL